MRAVTGFAAALIVLASGGVAGATTAARVPHTTHARAASCATPRPVAHRQAPGTGRTVALTFDDGPGPTTWTIIEELEAAHVRATFFNIGDQLAEHPWAVRREVHDGDALGNHTWSHPDLLTLSWSQRAWQVDRAAAEQRSLTGTTPCLFRPPYGDYDTAALQLAASRHEATWLWSVDTEDWKAEGSSAAWWVNRIVSRAEAGAAQAHPVILMHNMAGWGTPATARALPRIISFYKARGYRFVVLSDPAG